MATLKKVFLTLEYKDEDLGGRWKDSKTELILSPKPELITGSWNTQRGSDIDSSGGSDHAVYEWSRVKQELKLLSAGWQSKELTTTLVVLKSLNEFKLGARGTGIFYFRKKEVSITWNLTVMEYAE